jgi:uncharacterized protein (DUF983 family)
MANKNLLSSMGRGACMRCPNCGRGHLFRAFLKPVDACSECGEPLKQIRADDGPAWLTVLVVGHLVVGLALYMEMRAPLPVETSLAIFLALTAILTLLMLPRAKGIFIGAIWAMDATGVDIGQKAPQRP